MGGGGGVVGGGEDGGDCSDGPDEGEIRGSIFTAAGISSCGEDKSNDLIEIASDSLLPLYDLVGNRKPKMENVILQSRGVYVNQ